MQVKIERTARELKPLKGAGPSAPLYTGVKIGGKWYNLHGDHRNLYNKVVDLELNGTIAKFTQPQTPPAPAQRPPTPPPAPALTNGHTPRWATRDDAVDAYIFYTTELGQYITEPAALVRAVNCLVMQEADGEINPTHRPRKDRG
jgi:hypothetical protein